MRGPDRDSHHAVLWVTHVAHLFQLREALLTKVRELKPVLSVEDREIGRDSLEGKISDLQT